MNKYKFRLYTADDPEDGFWAWTVARTPDEARERIKHEYHSLTRIELFSTEKL